MSDSKKAKAIKKFAGRDPHAYAFLGWLATYTNWVDEMPVLYALKKASVWARENMDDAPSITRSGIVRVMRELEELEVGQFWVGRRGAESRFEFWVNRGQLGKAALGEVNTLKVEEDAESLDQEELIELHRQLIANALKTPLSSIRIKVKEG